MPRAKTGELIGPRRSRATKPPTRWAPSDDFAVEESGERYLPHAGEGVEFRGRSTVASIITGLRLQSLLRLSGLDEAQARETSELYERVVRDLAGSIVSWTWTDDQARPLPSPPSAEVIQSLSVQELFYLIGARNSSLVEGDRKNGSSPST